jgi:DNA-binding MltR family transcriptional regulator
MVKLTPEEHDQLFIGTGPLATFSAKIRLGYALGIYGRKTRHDLDVVREIRNAFAHAQKVITFENQEIANLCSGFHCLQGTSFQKTQSARIRFIAAIKILVLHLARKGDVPNAGMLPGVTLD